MTDSPDDRGIKPAGGADGFAGIDHPEGIDHDGFHDPEGTDAAVALVARLSTLPAPRTGPKHRPPKAPRPASGLEPVGDVVDQVAKEYGFKDGITLHGLKSRWPGLVGAVNAQHSAPERLADTVLTVRADSSTWASALRLLAPQLVAKLNETLGDGSVTRVDVQGPTGPTWKHGLRSVRDGRGPRDTYG